MTGALAAALVQAQAAMPAVEADKVNPHFKSKFVSLDHLIAKTRPVLNKHGLAITQAPTHLEGQPALQTMILHESGESLVSVMPLLVAKSDMQALGSAVTYAKRYAWSAACGISADEDDDGESAATATTADAGHSAKVNGSPKATKAQVDLVETLIRGLNESNKLGEPAIRDGMRSAYGTEVTAELSPTQATELSQRLTAKAAS